MTPDQEREQAARDWLRANPIYCYEDTIEPASESVDALANLLRDREAQAFREGQEEMRDQIKYGILGVLSTIRPSILDSIFESIDALPLTERREG